MKYFFNLCVKSDDQSSDNFSIEDNSLVSHRYQARYNFDAIEGIEDTEALENQIVKAQSSNNYFIVFGKKHSGKSTLLRGKQKINEAKDSHGIILKIVKQSYNKMFDLIDNRDEIVVLKFGAFGFLLSNDNHENYDVTNLIDQNKDKNSPSYFDQIMIGQTTKAKKQTFCIKHISSFNHLASEMQKVVVKKDNLYDGTSFKDSYAILYHFSVELKTKELTSKIIVNLNFYEINCQNPSVVQPFLIEINNTSKTQDILNKLTYFQEDAVTTFINVLCFENLSVASQENLDLLKVMRFLQLNFEREELYENSKELCEQCCSLSEQLTGEYKNKETILRNIEEMTDEAQKIYSLIRSMNQYKRNTLSKTQYKFLQKKFNKLSAGANRIENQTGISLTNNKK